MTVSRIAPFLLVVSLSACQVDIEPLPPDPEPTAEAPTAQSDNNATPPEAVAAAFAAAHPTATDVEWQVEADGRYEAEFKEDGAERSVVFAADGTAGAVETEIAVSELPAEVTAALARDYADYVVTEAARIEDNGATTYEAEVTRDGAVQDFIFQADGTFVDAIPAEAVGDGYSDPEEDDDEHEGADTD